MKIIISPAMKMKIDSDSFAAKSVPCFLKQAQELATFLKQCDFDQLQKIWQSSSQTTKQGQSQIKQLDLAPKTNLTPAIMSYSGIQYQYMAPDLFSAPALAYLQDNVRIISGLYGVLRPFDGVWPYRLEMKNKVWGFKEPNLYDYWGSSIADWLFAEDDGLINLASKEYSKNISPYLTAKRRMITVDFQEKKQDKWQTVGVHAKMARGEMVRFASEQQLSKPEDLQHFNDFGFEFVPAASTQSNYLFRTEFAFKKR